MAALPLEVRVRDSRSAAAPHVGSSDIGRYPNVANAAPVGGHKARTAVGIPGMAIVGLADVPDKHVPRRFPGPTVIPHAGHTMAPEAPKSARKVDGPARLGNPPCRISSLEPPMVFRNVIFFSGPPRCINYRRLDTPGVAEGRPFFFPATNGSGRTPTKLGSGPERKRRQECAGFDKGCSAENRSGRSIYAALTILMWSLTASPPKRLYSAARLPEIPRRTLLFRTASGR